MSKKVYNKLYSKEKWEQVNKYNKQMLDDYILEIKAQGKSEGSIKQYYSDGRIIMILVMELFDNKPLHKFTRKMARNLILHFQELDMSNARINRLLSTFRNIFNYAIDGGDEDLEEDFQDCKLNPSRIKGMQKSEKREIVFLTDKEVHDIVDKLIEEEKYQQALLVAIAYDSGARRNELRQLNREDISLDKGISLNKVTGKRGKKFRIFYNDLTKKVFKLYDESRTDDSEFLWITKDGEGVVREASYESLYSWMVGIRKTYEEIYGINKEFNVHSLRHSLAQNLKDGSHYLCQKTGGKMDITIIQKLMNHSDVSTTLGYCKEDTEDELLAIFG